MSLQEQTKEARIVLNQLTESIDSIQSHLFAIFSLSEQWQNSQNSFTLIQASLGSHINDLETKQREFELKQIAFENQRKQVELRQKRLDSAERSLEERSREFEKKEKEWKEVLPMEKKNVSEESKSKEMKFAEKCKLLEEREIRVQERSLMIELKEKEIDERCKAVELEENRINEKCIEIERREKHVMHKCKLLEFDENRVKELERREIRVQEGLLTIESKEKAIELKEKELDESRKRRQLSEKKIREGFKTLELREKQLNECFAEYNTFKTWFNEVWLKNDINGRFKELEFNEKALELREKEIDERCKAVELEENRIGEKCTEIERREKHVMHKCKLLEFDENRVKELEEREARVQERSLMIESREKAVELKENESETSRRRRQFCKKKYNEALKALELRERFKELEFKEKALELRKKEIEDRSKAIQSEEMRIRKRRKILRSKESGIDKEKQEIRKRVVELENKEKGLEVREMAIDECSQALESKEMQINERFGDSCSQAQIFKEKHVNEMEVKKDELDKRCNEQGLKEKQVCTDEDVVIENAPYKKSLCIADVVQRLSIGFTSSICVNTLERFLCTYNKGNDHELIRRGVLQYLQGSKIPTVLVLRALHGIFPSHLKKSSPSHLKKRRRVFRPVFRPVITPVCEKFDVRSGCVFLLEQLLIMAPKINDSVKRDALEVANMWREKMSEDKSHNVVLGFLLLVVVYDLVQNFDRDDLKKFYAMIDGHWLAPELRLGLLLVEKSDGVLHMEGPVSSSTMNICNVFKPFCSNMDADGLRSSLIEHGPYPEKIMDALRFAKDPTKLVFNVVRSFNQPDSSTFDKANCIYLLEQLTKLQKQLSGDPLGSLSLEKSMNQSYLNCEVKSFASLWRRQLLKDDAEQLEIYGFLQFLVTFKLAKSYNKEELFNFFKRFYDSHVVFRPEQNPWLCQELGLRKKVAGLIKQLIKNNKRLQAVKYIHAFMQEYHYPLASVLKKHVEFIQEQAVKIQLQQEGSVVAELKAFQIELVHLRAVVHLIKDFELESEYCRLDLTSRIQELEVWIADLKAAYQDAEGRYCSELASVDIEKELEKIDCTTNLDEEEETVGNGSAQLGTGMAENNESVHSSGTGLKRILSPTTFPTRRSQRIKHLSKASVPSPTTMHPYLFYPIHTSFSPPPQGGTISSEHLG